MGKKRELLTSSYHGNSNGRGGGNDSHKEDIYCGIGPFRPRFMQGCANIGCMTAALCFAGLASSTLNLYIASQITTLERQFGFSSSISGILLSCNDFGYLLTTLLMSYLARRVHIPRALSVSMMLFGISGLMCAVPIFFTWGDLPSVSRLATAGNISFKANSRRLFDGSLCQTHELSSTILSPTSADLTGSNASILPEKAGHSCDIKGSNRPSAISEDWQVLAVSFIGIGMVFQGFGKSCRHPFIGTYIDDNVPKTKTTLYLGIVSAMSIFGPVMAFTVGGLFNKIYLTLEETTMSPTDPRWVGAWWLGFLVFGLLGILASLPTLCFPRHLKTQRQFRQPLQQNRKNNSKGRQYVHDLKEFAKSILRLLTTPVYVCVVLGSCTTLFGVSGMFSFMPKYLETQFLLPAWKANITFGVVTILAASAGSLTGGCVTSRFKMSPRNCLKLMTVASLFACAVILTGFFLGCDQPHVSMGAASQVSSGNNTENMTTCSASCGCDDAIFFPTCGADGVTYFSPCHAGCSENRGMTYSSCSCINITMSLSSNQSTESAVPEARPGFCSDDCKTFYPYIALNFVAAFISTICMMPAFLVNIRSVTESDKPLAIGLAAFMNTLLGFLPGPVVFGLVVDTTCLRWSSGCSGSGSCSLYSLPDFRYKYHAAFLSSRVATCIFYIVAFIIATFKTGSFTSHVDNELTLPLDGEKLMLDKFYSTEDVNGAGEGGRFMEKGKIFKGVSKV